MDMYSAEIIVMSHGKEVDRVDRLVKLINGNECVLYHAYLYKLKGWAEWERYIDLQHPLSYRLLKLLFD